MSRPYAEDGHAEKKTAGSPRAALLFHFLLAKLPLVLLHAAPEPNRGQGIISSQLHAVCHCVGVSLLIFLPPPSSRGLFCVFPSFPFHLKHLTSSTYPSFTLSASRSLSHFLLPLSLMRSNSPSLNLPAFYLPLFLVPLSPSMRLSLSLSLPLHSNSLFFTTPLSLSICQSVSLLPPCSFSTFLVLALSPCACLEPCLH